MQNANGQQSALMHVMYKRFSGGWEGLSLAAVINREIEMAKCRPNDATSVVFGQ